jgi:hypothetical protein
LAVCQGEHLIMASKVGEERLKFQWMECGGRRVETPNRRGFGLRMLE